MPRTAPAIPLTCTSTNLKHLVCVCVCVCVYVYTHAPLPRPHTRLRVHSFACLYSMHVCIHLCYKQHARQNLCMCVCVCKKYMPSSVSPRTKTIVHDQKKQKRSDQPRSRRILAGGIQPTHQPARHAVPLLEGHYLCKAQSPKQRMLVTHTQTHTLQPALLAIALHT